MKYFDELTELETVMIDLSCHVSLLQAYALACESGLNEEDRQNAIGLITDSMQGYCSKLFDMHEALFNRIREDTHEEPKKSEKGRTKGKDKV